MAVNFVSSPSSVSATAVQTVQKTGSKRIRAGNGKWSSTGDLLGDPEGGRLLKDLVVVLSSTRKPETNKGTTTLSAICRSPSPLQKCIPDSGMQLAIASLNAATREFSTLAEKMITIADSDSGTVSANRQQDVDHTNSNNTIVNEKEKTEPHIYNTESDDITLDDSKTPSPSQSTSSLRRKPPLSTNGLEIDGGSGGVSIDNNTSSVTSTPADFAVCQPKPDREKLAAVRDGSTATQDCIYPRGRAPLLDDKIDKLLDNVVKIKADMHQKIDRLSRRIDQIRLDVQLNIDNADRAVYNNILEIAGIPYRRNENLQQCFRRICLLLGYAESDIPLVDIRRKRVDDQTFDKTETTTVSNGTVGRTNHRNRGEHSEGGCPAVVIEFIFKSTRDAFYRTYSKHRGSIRLSDIGLDSDRRIYVNESLTRMNQKLKSAALRKKREGLLHAVYTVDGTVYVQQQPGQKGRRISSVGDLD